MVKVHIGSEAQGRVPYAISLRGACAPEEVKASTDGYSPDEKRDLLIRDLSPIFSFPHKGVAPL
jgi:hypothetical protein